MKSRKIIDFFVGTDGKSYSIEKIDGIFYIFIHGHVIKKSIAKDYIEDIFNSYKKRYGKKTIGGTP